MSGRARMMSRWKRHSVEGFSGPDQAPYSVERHRRQQFGPQDLVRDGARRDHHGVAEARGNVADAAGAEASSVHRPALGDDRGAQILLFGPHPRFPIRAARWRPAAWSLYLRRRARKRPRLAKAAG